MSSMKNQFPRESRWTSELWHRVYIEQIARDSSGIGAVHDACSQLDCADTYGEELAIKMFKERMDYVRHFRKRSDRSARALADECVRVYLESAVEGGVDG
jgi:hypothetical protein